MKIDKVKQGKKNRASGQRFERKVRADLESKGFIVDRWSNNVDLSDYTIIIEEDKGDVCISGKLIPAKSFMGRSRTNGFPDYLCIRRLTRKKLYEVIGVECKINGYLDKTEKEKCKWLLDNKIFSKILIASRGEKRGKIEYKEFK